MDLTGLPFPPHIVIIDNIYFLPMAWRKLILDSCRIQAPISTNNHLLSEYEKLEPYTSIYVEEDLVKNHTLLFKSVHFIRTL
jgi:hypothetical protein